MFGEQLFNIEDDLGDYSEQLTEQINNIQPSELKLKSYKAVFEKWVSKINSSKKLFPTFEVDNVRRHLALQISKVESSFSYLDTLKEGKFGGENFQKIFSTFLILHSKIAEIENEVNFFLFSLTVKS